MRRRVLQLQNAVLRHLAIAGLTLLIGTTGALLTGATGARAQSGDAHNQDQSAKPGTSAQPADVSKENQRKTDEFVEAAQALNGPAGNPECVWLGRRVVRLMWNDDLDTAFRHLDLYDRFGCPGGHIQAAFRCLTRFGSQIDPKVADTLNSRVHACWINPGAQPQQAAATPPAAPYHGRQRRARPCRNACGGSTSADAERLPHPRQIIQLRLIQAAIEAEIIRLWVSHALKTPPRHTSC